MRKEHTVLHRNDLLLQMPPAQYKNDVLQVRMMNFMIKVMRCIFACVRNEVTGRRSILQIIRAVSGALLGTLMWLSAPAFGITVGDSVVAANAHNSRQSSANAPWTF